MMKITDIKQGDHICCIYETKGQQMEIAIPFFRQGLAQKEKVLYITHLQNPGDILDRLQSNGLNIHSALESGQLSIINRQETSLMNKKFFNQSEALTFIHEQERFFPSCF